MLQAMTFRGRRVSILAGAKGLDWFEGKERRLIAGGNRQIGLAVKEQPAIEFLTIAICTKLDLAILESLSTPAALYT
jgi:hypothetical protein